MNSLSLAVDDIAASGLTAAVVMSIVNAGRSGEGMSLEHLYRMAESCELTADVVDDALQRLVSENRLIVEDTPFGTSVKTLKEQFLLNDITSRRLRQYGATPAQVKRLKEEFGRKTAIADQTQQSFLSFALAQLTSSAPGTDRVWRPSSTTVNHLISQGVGEDFIESAIFPFSEKYDSSKGGGDINANFLRFVSTCWKKANTKMPEAWLPSTSCNKTLLDRGFRQRDILRSALEFRIRAKERGMVERDWDRRFVEYMENSPSSMAAHH